jgi:hypothetical protein
MSRPPFRAGTAKVQGRSSRHTELIKFDDDGTVVYIADSRCAVRYRVLDPGGNLIAEFVTLADLRIFLDSRPDLASSRLVPPT